MLKLWIITEVKTMSLIENPLHPGAVLKELYLDPLGLSAMALAGHLRVRRTRIERLVKGETRLTPDTALRLAKAFNTTPAYWLNMQGNFDVAKAARTVNLDEVEPLEMA